MTKGQKVFWNFSEGAELGIGGFLMALRQVRAEWRSTVAEKAPTT